ncbi:MAG: dipeptidase [Bacteroidia bacterium]
MKFLPLCLLSIFLWTACSSEPPMNADARRLAIADSLAHAYIITDGHVDLPYRMAVKNFQLVRKYLDNIESTEDGDFDFKRAKEGGLDVPFMSIYIPASYQQTGGAKAFADSLIDMVNSLVDANPDKFGIAGTPQEAEALFAEGKLSLPMGMENGAPMMDDIANVAYFHERGIRYVTLTHSKDNQICDSSYDTTNTWNGLSPFGVQIVNEMNRVGTMVDISHVSDSTFYDVLKIVKAPVIASHSSCRKYTPGFERNMNDDMIKMLGENGGVIQINFGSSFLDSAFQAKYDAMQDTVGKWARANKLAYTDSAVIAKAEEYMEAAGNPFATVQIVADHIDNVVALAGIDHVGLGSDFDGVGDTLPIGLKDVSDYPNLIAELLKRGYSHEDIEKICYKNVWRVWNEVIAVAERSISNADASAEKS